ncbi:unnamed protein product [Mytilus edulis]|uniref:Mutator-like transposase domain-containing protein n=2 Tax=Mytilus TaxID=6548 RepID=A0A8S3R270_MYTED|nr:unnamed protein product [Mytilus edulis]
MATEKQDSSRKRPPNFRIEIPGDETVKSRILEKLQKVKGYLTSTLNKPVNNSLIIEELLDFWIKQQLGSDNSKELHPFPSTYSQTRSQDVDQGLFVTAEKSLDTYGELFEAHTSICNGKLKVLKRTMKGHVASVRLMCTKEKSHSYLWSSSSYLPNDEFLVNHRICHAFYSSGLLPVHYTRFVNGAGIGCITKERRSKFFRKYKEHAENESVQSVDNAINDEISSYDDLDGINIMTDARHGWRKNAKDTTVVALGEKTHKVMDCEHITKSQDKVAQRHERLGTQIIYENLENKNVSIKIHAHDRNLAVNKFVRDTQFTVNQNDLWHAVKAVKKAVTKISKGTKRSEGISWSVQLGDKVEPIATHINWAVRNCEQNSLKLKESLDNIVNHYCDNHENCHHSSRCRFDSNYEPSRTVLTNLKARKMLEIAIKSSTIYKYPQDYILAKDTFYVESFNNVVNIFQDKRICFGDDQYKLRSNLAVCHWNENVDRGFTSVWKSRNPNAPASQKGKKIYKKLTYNYRINIWNRYISSFY